MDFIRGDTEDFFAEGATDGTGTLLDLSEAKVTVTIWNKSAETQLLQFGRDFAAEEDFGEGGTVALTNDDHDVVVTIEAGATDGVDLNADYGMDAQAEIAGRIYTIAIDDSVRFRRDYTRPVEP